MLGLIAQQQGKSELALQLFDAALTAAPDLPQARFNRALVLRNLKRDTEALESLRALIATAPRMAEAWDLIGQILKDQGSYAKAYSCFSCAIDLQPDNAHFHGNFGLLLFAQHDFEGAYREARLAEKLDPAYPPMLLGNLMKSWGYPEQAAKYFARVRELMPHFADAAASEAMEHLQMGDWEKGWALWEQRPDLAPELRDIPFWQGQKTAHLLVYEDQGLGDAIQFLRYLPLLRTRTTHVTLRIHPSLHRLCAENFSSVTIISNQDPLAAVDARCRLSSLAFFFAARPDAVPTAPYLTISAARHTRDLAKNCPSPRIGLVWAGNTKFHNDAARSIDFSLLPPLLACSQEHVISLQKEHSNACQTAGIKDAAPLLKDFADTAALIRELDLVISVDTATAHLAGALGKPVFILLSFYSDWRWFLGREDSPWYPSARLFRQQQPGDWQGVIESVAADIKKFLAGDRSVIAPAPWQGEFLRRHPGALPLS